MPGFDWNTNKNFWDKSQKDIAGEFGLPEKYTKFIDDYDPFKENVANRAFSTGVSGLRKEDSQSLFDMLKSSRETSGKSGFASSGAIGRDVGNMRNQLSDKFGTQMEGMRTDRYSSIMGSRKDYEKSIYDMMGNLAQSGVEFGGQSRLDSAKTVFGTPNFGGNQDTDDRISSGQDSQSFLDQYGFPTNPSNLQKFTSSDGKNWIFNGPNGWEIDFGQGGG